MLDCPQISLADGVNLGLEGPGTWQMAPGILGFCGRTSGKQLQTSCCSSSVNHPSSGIFLLFIGQFCRPISQQLGKVHDRTGHKK